MGEEAHHIHIVAAAEAAAAVDTHTLPEAVAEEAGILLHYQHHHTDTAVAAAEEVAEVGPDLDPAGTDNAVGAVGEVEEVEAEGPFERGKQVG